MCNGSSGAEAVPPIKTSSSTWWATVLGPGTGKIQPIAGGHVGSPRAPGEAEHGACRSTCLKESSVETAFDDRAIENQKYDLPNASYEGGDCVQSSRDRGFRIPGRVHEQEVERCGSQPSFLASCGSTSFAHSGHWMVRGDARRYGYYGTYASDDMYLGSPVASIMIQHP